MMEIAKLIESEIGDFFAGFGHPGEPETPEEMQSQLLERVMPLLAWMEQEPVAKAPELSKVIYHFRDWNEGFPVEKFKADYVISWMLANYPPAPLYAAPQLPQPSVVDEQYQHLSELYHSQEKRLFKIAQRIKGPSFDKYAYSPSQAIDVLESEIFGERECDGRAAMLQGAEPVEKECMFPEDFNFDRFNDLVWLEAVASNPHMHSPTTSTIAMVALELNRKLAAGNSPVIPDGLNIRAVAALREAVRNQWLKSDDFADRVYWKSMHDIANEIVSSMLAAAPDFREISNSSTKHFRENAETSTKCPKCGGRGSYHCPQMLGTVECECTLPAAPQQEVK